MRILVDMDGVLCDLMGKWLQAYNEEFDDNLSADKLTEWGPHRFAKGGKRIYKYLSVPGFFRDLTPLPGAIENMRRLVKADFDIVIVTAARRGHKEKRDWVIEHLPFFDPDNMIFAHRKELIRGDIMLDDAPHNLERFSKYGGEPVAMAYPYNAHVPYKRVKSWDEFTEYVLERAKAPIHG